MFRTLDFLGDHWRDADGVVKFLASYGRPVTRGAALQWFARQRVPSEWAFLLLALLEVERGAPVSISKYLQ